MLGEASLLWGWSSLEINPTALVRIVQIIWLANETKADNAQAKLSVSSRLEEKNDRFEVRLLVWFENKDLNGIRQYCSLWRRALFKWKLQNKELKACGWKCEMLSCIWEEIQLFKLSACSKIFRTSDKFGKTKLLPLVLLRVQERILAQAFNWLLVG